MTTTISPGAHILTAINVLSVEPKNQPRVVELLSLASDVLAKNQPGFISANVHRGLDGTKVVNYVQWRSKQDFESVFNNTDFMQLYSQIKELARPEPNAYEIVHAAYGAL
jgi:heme-degrading monooxygenase HmoA